MSVNYAILGILSSAPQTGYSLKKLIQDSPFMPWSGNNNQIYKALLELIDEGYVTNEIQHQESAPSKKINTITIEGSETLKEWTLSEPEPPEFRKIFLMQLAFSQQLNNEELSLLLSRYENTVKMKLILHQKKVMEYSADNKNNERETIIWKAIYNNIVSTYQNELNWVQKTRESLLEFGVHFEKNTTITDSENSDSYSKTDLFEHSLVEKCSLKYIKFSYVGNTICSEQDILDMITICAEHNTNFLIIHGELLNGDFRKLSSGLAGKVLQKLETYKMKTAVITGQLKVIGKFKDMIHRCDHFRLFDNLDYAEKWILTNNQK